MLMKNSFKIKKIVLAVGVASGIIFFAESLIALPTNCKQDGSSYQCTIDLSSWQNNNGCEDNHDGTYVQKMDSNVSSIKLDPKITNPPRNFTITINAKNLQGWSESQYWEMDHVGQSLWNGVAFKANNGVGPSSILQPVIWKGENFSIPDDSGLLPSYIWVGDSTSDTHYIQDSNWNTFKSNQALYAGTWAAPMRLNYYENKKWNCIASASNNNGAPGNKDTCAVDQQKFTEKLNNFKTQGYLLVNSQYVEYDYNYYTYAPKYNTAKYAQISPDILVVPQEEGTSVKLEINTQANPIEINATITTSDGSTKSSTLSVYNLHSATPDEFSKILKVDSLWENANITGLSSYEFENAVSGTTEQDCMDNVQQTINDIQSIQNLEVSTTPSNIITDIMILSPSAEKPLCDNTVPCKWSEEGAQYYRYAETYVYTCTNSPYGNSFNHGYLCVSKSECEDPKHVPSVNDGVWNQIDGEPPFSTQDTSKYPCK